MAPPMRPSIKPLALCAELRLNARTERTAWLKKGQLVRVGIGPVLTFVR
jgi:hypothetical protein